MPSLKNSNAVSQKRGPQRFRQQGGRATDGSDVAAAPSKSQRSSGRAGPRRGRAAVMHKDVQKATGAGKGKAIESCAWPAYVRSAAEAEAEALAAVRTLYADELKPFGRILRKRVAERILQSNGSVAGSPNLDALPEVDAKQVRAVCEVCELLQVEEEDGGDWSAVFVDLPSTLVDVYSPEDCYHPQLWSELRAYCESPVGQDLSLPGGRYACAQALQALQLPPLAGFSLGRICHIVQLAISQKKIFGYMNGAVVPYARSQSMMKETCAMYGQPTAGKGNDQSNLLTLPIASLEVARKHVFDILDTSKGEAPLSNIKRLFRSKYQIELSETSFGYSKLSELLQGQFFSDFCRVELRGHGYTVIQTGQPQSTPLLKTAESTVLGFQAAFPDNVPQRVPLCADEPLAFDDVSGLTDCTHTIFEHNPAPTLVTGPAARRWCVSPSRDTSDDFIDCSVQHTFLQYKVPQTPLPGPKRRSHSLPKDMGRARLSLALETSSADDKLVSTHTCRSFSKLSHESESTTDGSGTDDLRKPSSHKRTNSNSSSEWSCDEASFGSVPQLPGIFWGPSPGTTPLPSAAQRGLPLTAPSDFASQFPAALVSLCVSSLETMDADDEEDIVTSGGSASGRNRVTFCPDEPLGFDEAEFFPQSPKAVVPPTPSPLPLYNYSETIPWRRHPICSANPQPLPAIAMTPGSIQRECSGIFSTSPPAQSGNVCSNAFHAPQHAHYAGCVLRLGEYL